MKPIPTQDSLREQGVHVHLIIQRASDNAAVPRQSLISEWIQSTLASPDSAELLTSNNVELAIRIVDEEESEELNSRFRKQQISTNVLSFPSDEQDEQGRQLIGDLVICAPVVEREAIQQEKDPIAHWAHIVVHGLLHLLGFEHDSEEQAFVMETREIRALKLLGFGNPY